MYKRLNIRLYPTKEQEVLMNKHIGAMRFIWNWGLSIENRTKKEKGFRNGYAYLSKQLTILKNTNGYNWLYEVSNATLKESLRDLNKAFKEYKKGNRSHPKFKSKKKDRLSFYSRYEKIKFTDNTVNLEKIGKVKYKSSYGIDLSKVSKFSNPRVIYNGRCWVLTVGMEVESEAVELNKFLSIGVDLGVKKLAVTNIGLEFDNINKSKKVKDIKSKLKRLQRQCSRKYEMNREGVRYQKTSNIRKLELKIKKLHSKLSNIRLNYIHQTTNSIVKTKPYRVVMEDLNIRGMLKNKHLSKSIREQCLYTFVNQMEYKCEKYGVEFIQVPRFYPSSKLCSNCGELKKGLKLSDRQYECSCGLSIDRDRNASINLSQYGLA